LRADGALFSRFDITPRGHARALPGMLDAVLSEARVDRAGLTHVAFANGPGAFTGVRIAAATAQGIATGLGLPLIGVSTLAVLAQQVADEQGVNRVQAMIDARMGEAYVGLYRRGESGLMELQGEERLLPLNQLGFEPETLAAGSALKALAETEAASDLPAGGLAEALPHAAALARLARPLAERGAGGPDAPINYLRNQVAVRKTPTVY
jgi:tRNA threonylcarbamoyladenosine biosynthesis protein TsaB